MNDWEQFRNQARQDIESCEILRSKGDYGNSAYLLQQGLEKYIKAYLFKFQMFTGKPHEVGHLPIKAMWKKLFEDLERRIRASVNPEINSMFQQSTTIIKIITELFENIKNPKNRTLKMAFWKQSLNIKLNTNEENITKHEREELEKEFKRIMPMAESILAKIDSKTRFQNMTNDQRQKIEQVMAQMGMTLEDVSKIIPTIQNGLQNTTSGMPDLFPLIKEIIKRNIKISDSSALEFISILRLAWLFTFRNEMVEAFTHEDIGRYPTEIDGKSSRDIYQTNVKNLDNFIERIKKACNEIESVLN